MHITGRPSLSVSEDLDPKPLAKKRKRSAQYEWTEKLLCDHARNYRDWRNPNLSPLKRHPNRQHNSIKSGCTAYIWLWKKSNNNEVHVEYFWWHTGHTVGSLKDLRGSCIPRIISNQIDKLVHSGMDWRSIKRLLKVDEEVLDSVCILFTKPSQDWHLRTENKTWTENSFLTSYSNMKRCKLYQEAMVDLH